MEFKNLKNMDKIIVRRGTNMELVPMEVVLGNEPGYYSRSKEQEVIEETEDKHKFEIDGEYYIHREGVKFKVTVPKAFENLKTMLTFNKNTLDKANMNLISEKITQSVWDNIGGEITENKIGVLNSNPKKVLGQNLEEDIYAGMYSIAYQLNYFIISHNKCEPSLDLDLMIENLESLDNYWKGKAEFEKILKYLGTAYDTIIDTFIQPYVKTEQEKVGQANLNKNIMEALRLYESIKDKIDYALAGQVDEVGAFIHLSEYLNMILGQEPDFYRMITMVRREKLDETVSRSSEDIVQFDSRLKVDDSILENQLIRMVRSVLEFQDTRKRNIDNLKKYLMEQTNSENRTEQFIASNRNFIKKNGNFLKTTYSALGPLREVNTTKVITLTETIYQTRFTLNQEFRTPEMNAWKTTMLKQSTKGRHPLTNTRQIDEDFGEDKIKTTIRNLNADYETLCVDFVFIRNKGEKDGDKRDLPVEIVVEYRIPNMSRDFYDITDLSWEVM